MNGDVTAAIEKVRDALDFGGLAFTMKEVRLLLAEVERLRAEREALLNGGDWQRDLHYSMEAHRALDEALHSDETRERVAHAIYVASADPEYPPLSHELADAVLAVLMPDADEAQATVCRFGPPGFEGTYDALHAITIRPKGTDA